MRHPLERIVSQPWYLLDAPWAHGDYAGTMILAGSPDPHVGLVVCDTNDLLSGETDVETARAVAEHIVDLHNDSVQADYQRLQADHERLQAERDKLCSLISDLKDWDCDVSGGFLSIPLDLRRRMQEAIDTAMEKENKQ